MSPPPPPPPPPEPAAPTAALPDDQRRSILAPPLQTPELPGTGGRLRLRPEDFRVEELPAYAADGRPDAHLLVPLTKQGFSSEEAVRLLAEHLEIDRREVGMAGRKDRVAITRQWISVPASTAARLARFEHPAITLGEAQPHGNKLRTGHLRGNCFTLVIRQLAVDPPEAVARARATVAALRDEGGLANFYGPQRFGREGHQLDRGLAALRQGRAGRRGNLVVSAGQAGLFNLYALLRRERGAWSEVLAGDLLRKRESGGMFDCTDPTTDQLRLRNGELGITGPIFGARMRGPVAGSASAALEAETLALAGVTPAMLLRLGRKAAGTRRALTVPLDEVAIEVAPPAPQDDLGPGLALRFVLPAGSFATQLCREIEGDKERPANIDPPELDAAQDRAHPEPAR